MRSTRKIEVAASLVVCLSLSGGVVQAETTKPNTIAKNAAHDPGATGGPASSAAAPTAPTAAERSSEPSENKGVSVAKVSGFRSAQFGMDETAVRAAAIKDFNVPASAIHKTQNLGERTDILTVRVPELLPGGGASDVAYAFGYKSKKLTQVSVVWSKGTDKAITPEQMLADSEALREYFLSAGYDAKTLVTNSPVRDGILLFRGTDADGHTTAMMLHGTTTAGADKTTQTFVPNALLLFYIADPKTPDVFKVEAGRF